MLKGMVFAAMFLVMLARGDAQTFRPICQEGPDGKCMAESAAYGPHGTGPSRVYIKTVNQTGGVTAAQVMVNSPGGVQFQTASTPSKLIRIMNGGVELASIPGRINPGDEVRVLRSVAIALQILSTRPEEQMRNALPTIADAVLDVSELMEAAHPGHCSRPDPAECLPMHPPGARCCTKCRQVCKGKL